jgi:hypothetical protein
MAGPVEHSEENVPGGRVSGGSDERFARSRIVDYKCGP